MTSEQDDARDTDADRSPQRAPASAGARVSELEATVDRLERELAQSRTRERESADIGRARVAELRRVQGELDGLRRRRSVRLAIWGTSRLRRARSTLRTLARDPRRALRRVGLDALHGSRPRSDAPFHVAITLTSLDRTAGFGDWYTGHELGDALEALGWRVSYLGRKDGSWYRPDRSVDAIMVLIDAYDITRLPRGLVSMAWIRNWPERWLEHPWFGEFDIVFASSARIAAMVRDGSSKTATLLPIATNPDRFHVAPADRGLSYDVLFTGNYWGEQRDVLDALPALAERGINVRVHGRGWQRVPAMASLDGGVLDYDDLPAAYATALIVVDDAATPTKECGSVNSRVFDALAAGAIVVTSGAVGVHDLFDPAFPTWSDPSSLVESVEQILRDPTPALDRARAYQALVLTEHTYALRARTVRDTLAASAASPTSR
jgi:hypothetical protein